MAKILILLFGCLLPLAVQASAGRRFLGRCDYYAARESEMRCGPRGYLLAFGDHYCRRFERAGRFFSEPGRKTLVRIKVCLQAALERSEGLTCANIKGLAIETHVSCYRAADFCGLSFLDKARLFSVIVPALSDPDFLRVAGRIEDLCAAPSGAGR